MNDEIIKPTGFIRHDSEEGRVTHVKFDHKKELPQGYSKLNPVTDRTEIKAKQKIIEKQVENDTKAAEEMMLDSEIIEGARRFTITGSPYEVKVEIKWFKNGHRRIKLMMNGVETTVERDALMTILFMLANREQRRKSINQFLTRVRPFSTRITLAAKKDIKKGEPISAFITIPLPLDDDGHVMLPSTMTPFNQVA